MQLKDQLLVSIASNTTVAVQQQKPLRADKRNKPTRAEKAAALREKILHAAAQVIGELGYQDASVARITQLAGIAQGTFYLYFETRQALFDEVLPFTGHEMVTFIGDRVRGSSDIYDVESRGIRAFFDYLKGNPGFYRLLNEAEFAAPAGYRDHMEQLEQHYAASLGREKELAIVKRFGADGLRAFIYSAMGARSYLYLAYVKLGNQDRPPESAIESYLELIRNGLK